MKLEDMPVILEIEGGKSIEDLQKSIAEKFRKINLKDYKSLKFLKATGQLEREHG